MNDYIERARKMRTQLNNLTANFNDEEALNNKELYMNWNGNGIYLQIFGHARNEVSA